MTNVENIENSMPVPCARPRNIYDEELKRLKCEKEKTGTEEHGSRLDSSTFSGSLSITDSCAPKWTLNDFDIARKLGEGQFGAVYLGRERRSGYIVAIKAIRKAMLLKTSNEHLLRREIEIHSHLIHPNILGFYGWFTTQNLICLIIEIAPKGELMDRLAGGGLKESVVSRYMMQMISAIRACHRLNVIHRDLKPENILIDMEGKLKLADFGWAAHIPEDSGCESAESHRDQDFLHKTASRSYDYLKSRRKTYCGTMDYLSPEIVRQEWYGKEVDLWCLGILCYELVTGGPPFAHEFYRQKGYSEEKARQKQQEDIQKCDIESKLLPNMSPELKDYLRRTLDKNPQKRITPNEMLMHPFIVKYNGPEIQMERAHDKALNSTTSTVKTPSNFVAMDLPRNSWNYSRLFLSSQHSDSNCK